MKVGIPKETFSGERRVATAPEHLTALGRKGFEVIVESDAGLEAGITNAMFEAKGAKIASSRSEIFSSAEIILQVRCFPANQDAGRADLDMLQQAQILIGSCDPLGETKAVQELAGRGVTTFAMELMPRITRAQSMDILSSMATIAGYKAVVLAAQYLPQMFPMMMTAAGTVTPAHIFVIGAGVAGLQAIATGRKMGGVVKAYDIRPAVKEQIESLGAKFVEMELEAGESEDKGGYAKAMDEEFYRKQRELMMKVVSESDVVITTAAIPGKKSPVLVTEEMVKAMPAGSVLVDLAAERGGNCELTKADEVVRLHNVTILGPTNLPATVPLDASLMYGKNLANFLNELVKEEKVNLDMDNEVLSETLITRGGDVVSPRLREILGLPMASTESQEVATNG